MPFYDYVCLSCGHQFEKSVYIDDRDDVVCENCGESVRRLFNSPALDIPQEHIRKYPPSGGNREAEVRPRST